MAHHGHTVAFRHTAAFSLVELLVVIAILSVLAALLLPTLEQAVEQGRRVACAGNERQMATGVIAYTADFNDIMPKGPNVMQGQNVIMPVWGSAHMTYAAEFGFLAEHYAGVPLRYSSDNPARPLEPVARWASALHCPSMSNTERSAYEAQYGGNAARMGYTNWAFSRGNESLLTAYRNPLPCRMRKVASRSAYPGYAGQEKVLLTDFLSNVTGNHLGAGMNVAFPDGRVAWTGAERLQAKDNWTSGAKSYFPIEACTLIEAAGNSNWLVAYWNAGTGAVTPISTLGGQPSTDFR